MMIDTRASMRDEGKQLEMFAEEKRPTLDDVLAHLEGVKARLLDLQEQAVRRARSTLVQLTQEELDARLLFERERGIEEGMRIGANFGKTPASAKACECWKCKQVFCEDPKCKHPADWHRQGVGACLECGCLGLTLSRASSHETRTLGQ